MVFKVGCDPEFFLFDKQENMFVSAHDLIPGNKRHPFPLEKGAVQVDGTAVEFNIEPASNKKEFSENITTVLKQIRDMIPNRYKFEFTPAITYDKKYWETIPNPNKELGCDPDYDRNGRIQSPPQPVGTMRTGGGHLHLGWTDVKDATDPSHMKDCIALNNQINVNFQRYWDFDKNRSQMYGNGSPFRPKKYGLESRGWSNAWVKYPDLYPLLFDMLEDSYKFINEYPMHNRKYFTINGIKMKEIKL